MSYNRFYLMIVLRVLLITLTSLTITFYILRPGHYFTVIFFVLILAGQVVDMIRYINLTNREIASFIRWLGRRDPGIGVGRLKSHRSFRDIGSAIDNIRGELEDSRREMHLQSYYIGRVLEKVTVGIISFDDSGIIGLFNTEAARLLGVNNPATIDSIGNIHKDLPAVLRNLKPSRSDVLKLRVGDEVKQIRMAVDVFREQEMSFSVVSLQDMSRVLDEKEMEAWQGLIRVLRHEIMNSVTPITTLAVAMRRMLVNPASKDHGNRRDLENELLGTITLIEERSKSLVRFVDRYRDITSLPEPKYQDIPAGDLLYKTAQIFSEDMKERGIALTIEPSVKDLLIRADESLVGQVLVNLIKNAVSALDHNRRGQICLSVDADENWTIIRIRDNGPGIPADIAEKIFIPFFTTKKDGSGIGLSLTRQVMRLHGGTVTCWSLPGKETVFTLRFPKNLHTIKKAVTR